MQFKSISEFLAMGGYGFYVWLALGVSFVALAILVISTVREKRILIERVQQEFERKERIRQAKQNEI